MGIWGTVVNVLVFAFATFFVVMGLALFYQAATLEDPPQGPQGPNQTPPLPSPKDARASDLVILGIVFLLAAAPMYYYLFSENARGLPPPQKKPREPSPPMGPKGF